jgi:hypothetical protein
MSSNIHFLNANKLKHVQISLASFHGVVVIFSLFCICDIYKFQFHFNETSYRQSYKKTFNKSFGRRQCGERNGRERREDDDSIIINYMASLIEFFMMS